MQIIPLGRLKPSALKFVHPTKLVTVANALAAT